MLVTEAVFVVLFAAGFLVVGFFFVNDLALAGSYAVDVLLGRFVRTVSAEQYFQFVTLPAFGAISGGLISTGIAILVDQTPLKHDSKTYLAYLLIVIGLVLIVWGPIRVYKTLAKSENLDIGHRIDRLKAGDWAHDSKPAVIKAIKEKKDAITKKLNNKSRLFPAGLILVIASAAGYYASVYVHRGASPSLNTATAVR